MAHYVGQAEQVYPYTYSVTHVDQDTGQMTVQTVGLARPFLELAAQRRADEERRKRRAKEGLRDVAVIPPVLLAHWLNTGQIPKRYASAEGVERIKQLIRGRDYSDLRSYEGRV